MALQVWLPLNGTLENKGLSNVTVTNNGATVDNNGKIGKCYSLDGNDDYIAFSGNFFRGGTSYPFSICMWIYHNDTNRAILFGDYSLSGALNFNIELRAATNPNVRFYWGGSPDLDLGTLPVSQWVHLCITYDGTTLKQYNNGTLVNSITTSLSNKTKSSGDFYIGRDSRTGATALAGKVNDVRIYNHALSPKEVKEISKGLILHYKLDDPYIILSKRLNITWNLLINQNNFPNSISQNGVTGITNKSDGSIIFNGNCTSYSVISIGHGSVPITLGHIYIFEGCPAGGGGDVDRGSGFDYRVNVNGGYLSETGNGLRWTSPVTGTMNVYIRTGPTLVCNNLTFYPRLFDLTQMFGAGNEPSLTDFKLMFPSYYSYLYDAGTVKSFSATVYDSSGYCNHGSITGTLTINNDSPRYTKSTVFSSNTNYITAGSVPTKQSCSISFWLNPNSVSNNLIVVGHDGSHYVSAMNGSNIYNNGSGQSSKLYVDGVEASSSTSGTAIYFNKPLQSGWHHYCFTNIDLSSWTAFKLGGYGSSWPINGKLTDLRVYATALSEEDILELYNTSAFVTDNGVFAEYELYEDNLSDVKKRGLLETANFYENGAESGYALDTDKTRVASNYIISEDFIEI